MTTREMDQLFYIERMIRQLEDELEELEASAGVRSPSISDMPRTPGAKDRIGDIVPEIVDKKAQLLESIRQHIDLQEKLQAVIDEAPNVELRMILRLRYIRQKSWQEVADAIGGKATEASVRNKCYRYLGWKEKDQPPENPCAE